MKTFIFPDDNLVDLLLECKNVLDHHGVILLPTETVYGLVCRWDSATAREKIYQLKLRDHNKLLAMFADSAAAAQNFGAVLNPAAKLLFQHFTPGGITIITPAQNGGTVGVRVPDHPLVLALLKHLPYPLASTSANLSGTPAALSVQMALATLNGTPDLVIDGGALPPDSLASTVVNTVAEPVKILREGTLPSTRIFAVLNPQK